MAPKQDRTAVGASSALAAFSQFLIGGQQLSNANRNPLAPVNLVQSGIAAFNQLAKNQQTQLKQEQQLFDNLVTLSGLNNQFRTQERAETSELLKLKQAEFKGQALKGVQLRTKPGAVAARRTPGGGFEQLQTTRSGFSFQPTGPTALQQKRQEKELAEEFTIAKEGRTTAASIKEKRRVQALEANVLRHDLGNTVEAFERLGKTRGPIGAVSLGALSFAQPFVGRKNFAEFKTLARPLLFSLISYTTGQSKRGLSDEDVRLLKEAFEFKAGQKTDEVIGRFEGAIKLVNNRIKASNPDGILLPTFKEMRRRIKQGKSAIPPSGNIQSVRQVQ